MFWLESKGKSVNPLTYYKCIYIASQLTQPRLNSTIGWRNFHLLEILHISTSFAFSKPPHSSQLRALQCDTSVVCASLRVHLRIHLSCMSFAFGKPQLSAFQWHFSCMCFTKSSLCSYYWPQTWYLSSTVHVCIILINFKWQIVIYTFSSGKCQVNVRK